MTSPSMRLWVPFLTEHSIHNIKPYTNNFVAKLHPPSSRNPISTESFITVLSSPPGISCLIYEPTMEHHLQGSIRAHQCHWMLDHHCEDIHPLTGGMARMAGASGSSTNHWICISLYRITCIILSCLYNIMQRV